MAVFLWLPLITSLIPCTTSYFWRYRALNCGWRYGGQCKTTCSDAEYILGTAPCAFGTLGMCCAPTLPCSAYGGVCREGGCYEDHEVSFTYKMCCPTDSQSCCLRMAYTDNTGRINSLSSTPAPIPAIPLRCSSRPPFTVTSRILGGAVVNNPCQWPWMVSVRLGTPDRLGPHICAGVLVTDNKVLTTAGCVLGRNVFVTLGETDITRNGEDGEVNIALSPNYVIHENFNTVSGRGVLFENDIAILTLDTPVSGGSCAGPVCLPRYGERAVDLNSCYIAGWGMNEVGDGRMREANIRIANNSQCSESLAFALNIHLPTDKLCSFFDRSNACPGDRGGMLVCEDSSGTWSLFGLISDHACASTLPIVFTDIQNHLDWIYRNL